jgi:hypothetical protein
MSQVLLEILIRDVMQTRGGLVGLRQGVRAASADTSGLKGHLDKLDASLGGLGRDVDKLGDRWKNLTGAAHGLGLGMTVAGGAVVAGVGAAMLKTMEYGVELDNMRLRTGMSVKSLSEYGYMAQATGGDLSAISRSAVLMQKALVVAEQGSKGLGDQLAETDAQAQESGVDLKGVAAALQKLGIQTKDASGHFLPANEIFDKTIVALRAMKDPVERNGLAMQLFGRGAQSILPILNMTEKEYRALKATASDMAWTQDQADAARELSHGYEKLKASMAVALRDGLMPLMKDGAPLIGQLAEMVKGAGAFAATHPGIVKWGLGIAAANVLLGPLLMNSRAILSTWQLLSKVGVGLSALKIGGAVATQGATSALPIAYQAGAGLLDAKAAKRTADVILDDMATGAPMVGAKLATGTEMGLVTAAPSIGQKIVAAIKGADWAWAAIGVLIAGYMWIASKAKQAEDAETAAGKSGDQAGAKTAAGMGVGWTWVPQKSDSGAMIARGVARREGWQHTGEEGTMQEAGAGEGWWIPAGGMPKDAKAKRDLMTGVGAGNTDSQFASAWASFVGGSKDDPNAKAKVLAKLRADLGLPENGLAGAAGTPAATPAGTAAKDGKGLPDPKEEKQYQDLLRAWAQQVDLLEAEQKPEAEVAAAKESLAKSYDAYALRLEASGLHLEAVDAQIAAIRLRQVKKETERTDTGLGGKNETWNDRIANLQQGIDWQEAAGGNVTSAKLQMIDGLRSYAAALLAAGKQQEATDKLIAAMRIEAELRKEGKLAPVPTQKEWQDPRTAPRVYTNAEGDSARIGAAPRLNAFQRDMANAYALRSDVVAPSRDATVAAQRAAGGVPIVHVHATIGNEQVDAHIRKVTVETSRGAGLQPRN